MQAQHFNSFRPINQGKYPRWHAWILTKWFALIYTWLVRVHYEITSWTDFTTSRCFISSLAKIYQQLRTLVVVPFGLTPQRRCSRVWLEAGTTLSWGSWPACFVPHLNVIAAITGGWPSQFQNSFSKEPGVNIPWLSLTYKHPQDIQ